MNPLVQISEVSVKVCVRYADDTIVGFQHRQDAERFQIDLKERLAKFALSLHPGF
jgi:RNA-directed DNA polymerase